jgi:hypothetical protein
MREPMALGDLPRHNIRLPGPSGERNEDPWNIVDAAERGHHFGPNLMAKVPVTDSGMAAIEELVARDVACWATEIVDLSQVEEM